MEMLICWAESLTLSSANYKETTDTDTKVTTKTISGQGSVILWNKMNGGAARTELINVEPSGVSSGGFDFYNAHNQTGSAFVNGDKINPLLRLTNNGASFTPSVFVAKDRILSFKSERKGKDGNMELIPYGVYLQVASNTNKNGDRGDLYIGTGIADGASIRGVNGYYGKTITLTNSVSAPKIIEKQFHSQLSTPSSSSEACSAGDFKDDANYHYVCVAKNKWKRVALSDF